MSDFQHRHYVAVAAVIAKIPHVESREQAITNFSLMFMKDNPKFDLDRFTEAARNTPRKRDKVR